MSHPQKPRVSPNSGASRALAATDADSPTPTDASATASTSPADQSATGASWLAPAQRWLQQSGLTDSLEQVPEPLKRLAGQTADRWRGLSTTQKVVGGALLAAGAAGGWYLLSRPEQGAATKRRPAGDQAATLHELLLFVNDRIEGYQRAVDESKDSELKGYYKQLVSQSQQFSNELNEYLRHQAGGRETGTTLKGKLYRGWMDAKAALTGRDEKAILGSNIYGEEWALKAYEEALNDGSLTGTLRTAVQRQFNQSKKTHHKLQQLKNQQ
ncbi:PA2169 family four-helix-bundle protein [Hymenobacter sp. B81]|uniref:PA2169 family four-helix-bundle protein n=1 Tax=Hymenobacter sp. B81 TaxID=3344878 RepID=UPI0037DCE034